MTTNEDRQAARLLCALWSSGTSVGLPIDVGLLADAMERVLPYAPMDLSSRFFCEDFRMDVTRLLAVAGEDGCLVSDGAEMEAGLVMMDAHETAAVLEKSGISKEEARRLGRRLFDEICSGGRQSRPTATFA